MQADKARGQAVLISYAAWLKNKPLIHWAPSFDRVLIDSGALSELTGGASVNLDAYIEWRRQIPYADAYAALDDITGDTERSLRNLEQDPLGFPTFHNTDAWEYLPRLVEIAQQRPGKWLGIGIKPPREGHERWMRDTLEQIPSGIWLHGWALGAYTHLPRLDSVDSCHWIFEAWKIKKALPWITHGEAIELTVKKIQRQQRRPDNSEQLPLLPSELRPAGRGKGA